MSMVEVFDYSTNKIVKINYQLNSNLQVFKKLADPCGRLLQSPD